MRTTQPRQPKISRNSGSKLNGSENPGMKFSKTWVCLTKSRSRLALPEILANTFPFATGNVPRFKQEILVEWKASRDLRMTNNHSTTPPPTVLVSFVSSNYCKQSYYDIITYIIDTSYQKYMKAVHHSIYQKAYTV